MNADFTAVLKEIARNTKPMTSLKLIISGNKSELSAKYDTPIKLESKYKLH